MSDTPLKTIRPALTIFAALTALTGVVYPFAVTGVSAAIFPGTAIGSPIRDAKGTVRGSSLVGQQFTAERYFHGRPSATSPFPYNGASSGGSNLGPTNPALHERVREVASSYAELGSVPVDLVTASGSGLDPHISPRAARLQASRVAAARNLPLDVVLALVAKHSKERTVGILGEGRVTVLELNLDLDKLEGK